MALGPKASLNLIEAGAHPRLREIVGAFQGSGVTTHRPIGEIPSSCRSSNHDNSRNSADPAKWSL